LKASPPRNLKIIIIKINEWIKTRMERKFVEG
jgi:hypothetical protein